MGAAILDLTSWGPPSWTGSDVIDSIVTPILLSPIEPTVTNCDISDNNSLLKYVIADVTGK